MIEFRVLQYFLAVAREGNITRAAEALNITQPTLSRQMMELEENLGCRLFMRGGRRATLTEDGMLLRKRAEDVVSLMEKTEGEFSRPGVEVGGDVFIAAGETSAMRIIARAAKHLREKYPGIILHLFSGSAGDVAEKLDKGLADFGIFIGRADIRKYDYLALGTDDSWGLLLRAEDPLAAKASISPRDLYGIPIICSRQLLDDNELSGWLGSDLTKLNIAATYNLIYNASLLVEEGAGAALCISGLVDERTRGLCFRPLEPAVGALLVMAWKKRQVFSKAAEKFLEHMRRGTSVA